MSEEEVLTSEVTTTEEEDKGKKTKKPKSKVRKAIEWVFTILFGALFIFLAVGQVIGMINRNKNYGYTLTYGYASFVITTNSMEPEYPVKTAIITHKDSAENVVKLFDSGKHVDITFYSAYLANNQKYDYPYYRPGNITYDGYEYILEGKNPVYPTASDGNLVVTHRLIGYYIDESRAVGLGKYTFVVAGINHDGAYSTNGQYQLLTENEMLGIVKVNSQFLGAVFGFITSPWGLLVLLLIPAGYLVVTSVLDIFKAMKDTDEEPAVAGGECGTTSGSLDGLSDADRERLKREMLEEMLNKKGDGK